MMFFIFNYKERSVHDNGRLLTTRFGKRNGPLLTTRFGKRGDPTMEIKIENQEKVHKQEITNEAENNLWMLKGRLSKLGRFAEESRTPFQLWHDRRFLTKHNDKNYVDDYKRPLQHMRYQMKK